MNADRSAWRMIGRFALAFLVVVVIGALHNAGVARPLLDVLTLGGVAAVVWAFLGLRRAR